MRISTYYKISISFTLLFTSLLSAIPSHAETGNLKELKSINATSDGGISIQFHVEGERYLILGGDTNYLSEYGSVLRLQSSKATRLAARHSGLVFDPLDREGSSFKVTKTENLISFGKGISRETFRISANQGVVIFSEKKIHLFADLKAASEEKPMNTIEQSKASEAIAQESGFPVLEKKHGVWFALMGLLLFVIFIAIRSRRE